jgi:hypothetical protein
MCSSGNVLVVGSYVPSGRGLVVGSYVPFWFFVVGRQLCCLLVDVAGSQLRAFQLGCSR